MPNSKEKLLNALSMCRKAGKLYIGFDAVTEIINGGTIKLLLVAEDYSEASKKKLIGRLKLIRNDTVKIINTDLSMDEIWFGIGKKSGILGTNDENFAQLIGKTAEESIQGGNR